MDVVQFSYTTSTKQERDHQILDIKYRNKQVTGTEVANTQHNLIHTLQSYREKIKSVVSPI